MKLCDEQEGWLPIIGPCLEGTVHQALPGEGHDNPLYVVALDQPIEIPSTSGLVARGTPAGTYGKVVIKSRWMGFDAGNSSAVSVYLLLPPPGAIEEGRACLVKLPIVLWASCSTLASDA